MLSKLELFKSIFEKNALAHLSTIMKDGTPHSVPVWIHFEDEHFFISVQKGSQKYKNLSGNHNVALSIADPHNEYHYLGIKGKVVEYHRDENGEFSNFLSNKYSGGKVPVYPYSKTIDLLVYKIKPTKVFGWEEPFAGKFKSLMDGK